MTGEELQSWCDVLDDPDFDIQLQHMGYEIERQYAERLLWPNE